MKYAHILLCFVFLFKFCGFFLCHSIVSLLSFGNDFLTFIYILQGWLIGTGSTVWLFRCQDLTLKYVGKIGCCLNTTKHNKALNARDVLYLDFKFGKISNVCVNGELLRDTSVTSVTSYDGVSNNRRLYCLLNRLFRHRSTKHQSSASLPLWWEFTGDR